MRQVVFKFLVLFMYVVVFLQVFSIFSFFFFYFFRWFLTKLIKSIYRYDIDIYLEIHF